MWKKHTLCGPTILLLLLSSNILGRVRVPIKLKFSSWLKNQNEKLMKVYYKFSILLKYPFDIILLHIYYSYNFLHLNCFINAMTTWKILNYQSNTCRNTMEVCLPNIFANCISSINFAILNYLWFLSKHSDS